MPVTQLLVLLCIRSHKIFLKIEQPCGLLKELETVLQLIVLTDQLRVPIECVQVLEQLNPLGTSRKLPIVLDDNVQDLKKATLQLDGQSEDLKLRDQFCVKRIHFYSLAWVVKSLWIVSGVHILKKVMIVVAGLDLADILFVLASFELISHSVLHFGHVD